MRAFLDLIRLGEIRYRKFRATGLPALVIAIAIALPIAWLVWSVVNHVTSMWAAVAISDVVTTLR
jgi:uncharacterized protein (DUF983 family)